MGLNPFLALLLSWQEAKLFLKHSIAFSTDSVHVIAGVVIMLAAALWLRKPVSHSTPWLVVLGFAGLNEFVDLYLHQWPSAAIQYGEGVKDLLLTMLLPSLVLVTSRRYPRIYDVERMGGRRQGAAEEP